ncbi:MAG: hypothetical protein U1D30_08645 [Planctomycetota bacterium]
MMIAIWMTESNEEERRNRFRRLIRYWPDSYEKLHVQIKLGTLWGFPVLPDFPTKESEDVYSALDRAFSDLPLKGGILMVMSPWSFLMYEPWSDAVASHLEAVPVQYSSMDMSIYYKPGSTVPHKTDVNLSGSEGEVTIRMPSHAIFAAETPTWYVDQNYAFLQNVVHACVDTLAPSHLVVGPAGGCVRIGEACCVYHLDLREYVRDLMRDYILFAAYVIYHEREFGYMDLGMSEPETMLTTDKYSCDRVRQGLETLSSVRHVKYAEAIKHEYLFDVWNVRHRLFEMLANFDDARFLEAIRNLGFMEIEAMRDGWLMTSDTPGDYPMQAKMADLLACIMLCP